MATSKSISINYSADKIDRAMLLLGQVSNLSDLLIDQLAGGDEDEALTLAAVINEKIEETQDLLLQGA